MEPKSDLISRHLNQNWNLKFFSKTRTRIRAENPFFVWNWNRSKLRCKTILQDPWPTPLDCSLNASHFLFSKTSPHYIGWKTPLASLIYGLLGPAPHRDRHYRIGSNFWKFYLNRTSFTLGEPVSLVNVFRLFRLQRIVLVFRVWTQ